MKMASAGLNNLFLLDQVKGHCVVTCLTNYLPVQNNMQKERKSYQNFSFLKICDVIHTMKDFYKMLKRMSGSYWDRPIFL